MNNSRSRRISRNKKKTRWLRISLLSLLVILIGGGIYFFNVYTNVAKAVDKMNKPISRDISKKRVEKLEFHQKDPISILMVGVDEREKDSGRTDSILVLTVNPEKKTTKILSIPRDTRTKLIDSNNKSGKDRIEKINHAYAYGGIEETIDTVEYFLNIPIDYYVEVNMQGFKDIVNAVGGIDVDNKYAFELDGVYLPKGQLHLMGEKALQYARMRKDDPRGDFGREERQREVISKIIDKGKSFSTITNYNDILEALENNIKTNLTLNDIVGIQSTYKPAAENLEKLEISGWGGMVDGGWYFLVSDEKRQELSDQLREQLELPSEPVEKMYMNKENKDNMSAS